MRLTRTTQQVILKDMTLCKCGAPAVPNRFVDICKSCNSVTNLRYRRSIRGRIKTTFSHMKKRVRGKGKSGHLYRGLPIVTAVRFYGWSIDNKDFLRLHKEWADSGYDHLKGPSIDRLDTSKGYTLDNIRWVTVLENISRRK